jgi:ATP-binding cassette, subfamily F, member 3
VNAGAGEAKADRAAQRRSAADRRAEIAPLKKAMQAAEKRVEDLGRELAKLEAKLADPSLYEDAQRAQKLSLERGIMSKKLVEAEEDWLLASEAFETAEGSSPIAVKN